jgi:N-acyl-D-amino-acid deacylase
LSDSPARRFGCRDRGQVREGWWADLVVFDEASVVDNATYADPHQLPSGIDHVLVNGTPVIADGKAIENLPDPLPGRSLTFQP